MSSSTTKSHCTVISLHPVPAHLSSKEVAAKLEMVADAHLSLPICREGVIRSEIMVPNNRLDSYFKGLGYNPPQPVVIAITECKSKDHATQILADAEVAKVMEETEGFSVASVFTVDETIKIDTQSSEECDGTYVMLFECPPNLSPAELSQRRMKIGDELVQLPEYQKNVLKHTTWVKNEALAPDVQHLGMFSAEPLVIVLVQSSLDRVAAMLTEGEVKQYLARQDKTFVNRFGVDVVVKL